MPITSRCTKKRKQTLYHMKKKTPKTIRRDNRNRLAAQKKGMHKKRKSIKSNIRTKSKGKGTKRRRRRRKRRGRRRRR